MESNGTQAILENPAGVLSAALIGAGATLQLQIADGSRVLLTFGPHETTVRAKDRRLEGRERVTGEIRRISICLVAGIGSDCLDAWRPATVEQASRYEGFNRK